MPIYGAAHIFYLSSFLGSATLWTPVITFLGGVCLLLLTVVFASVSEYKKQRTELLRASLTSFAEGSFILNTIVRETKFRQLDYVGMRLFNEKSKEERFLKFQEILESGMKHFFISRMNLLSMGQTGIAHDIKAVYDVVFDHIGEAKNAVDLLALQQWYEKANKEVSEKRSMILQSFERQLREESDFFLAAKRYFGWNNKPCGTCGK